jgi:ribosomal protein S15P/S13E
LCNQVSTRGDVHRFTIVLRYQSTTQSGRIEVSLLTGQRQSSEVKNIMARQQSSNKPQAKIPAREAMENRSRVTFGKAYIRDVIAGTQRDFAKQLTHAIALGIGTPSQLKKLAPETLRERLAEHLKAHKKDDAPRNAEFLH